MFIKFADTDGNVFDYDGSTLDFVPDLGGMYTYTDGIAIVDRRPNQESTQLNVDGVIKTLRYLLKNLYPLQTSDIVIYLPRMDPNISMQADIQAKFSKLSNSLDSNQINYFNIKMAYV
ncbi:GrBNV gp41-like protein [Tomelloso virus]|uniref:GrBNV gp41-like protein n=1 Tax=Tomelloso virus TaxID=2053981 RepID=A0A2H4T2V5_9VIRU|nr:GrBNV gp41-like protein [Tomelloso virus]ATY70257.1 GrBNV gp41-like protein [Tomelloso virus]